MPEKGSYAYKLRLSDSVRGPVIRAAIDALKLPLASRGLDVGCGIGSHIMLLAETVGPDGHVTGLDISPQLLAIAERSARDSGHGGQVFLREGNMHRLPFDDSTFDWIWSVDCAGYAPGEPRSLLKELARVVRPGGTIAILAWSSQILLPGFPLLEARLNATSAGIAPFTVGTTPGRHFMRALTWFRDANVKDARARTFVGEIQAPLTEMVREFMISLFDMRWGSPKSELSDEEWQDYSRLCRPESPDFIVDLTDYCAFFTYTMFHGTVAG